MRKPFTKAGPGRPKGLQNRVTVECKRAFAMAFEGLGGVPKLIAWAQENQTEFYKLYARLIPVELSGSVTVREAADMTDAELADIAAGGSARAAIETAGANKLN